MFNFIKLYVCDNCGKFNPKIMDGKQSYTDCCIIKDKPYMSAGKRWRVHLQFPIKWVGFINYWK